MKIVYRILIIKYSCLSICFGCSDTAPEDTVMDGNPDVVSQIENTVKFGQNYQQMKEVLEKIDLKAIRSPSLSSPELMKKLGMIGEDGLRESEIASFALDYSEKLGACLWFNKEEIFVSYDKNISLNKKTKGRLISDVINLRKPSKD